jgi:hypothetical protein
VVAEIRFRVVSRSHRSFLTGMVAGAIV